MPLNISKPTPEVDAVDFEAQDRFLGRALLIPRDLYDTLSEELKDKIVAYTLLHYIFGPPDA